MKRLILLLPIIALLTQACDEDFLDRPSPTQTVAENFWKTEDDAIYALTGCYDALQQLALYQGSIWTTRTTLTLHDLLTDNATNEQWSNLYHDFFNGTLNAESGCLTGLYSASFIGITRCNEFLAAVETVPDISQERIDQYKAEVLFLRSLFYFNLAYTHGDVPLILEPLSIDDKEIEKTAKSVIIEQIIADLKRVKAELPNLSEYDTSELGRVTKTAASALLARVYLYEKNYEAALQETTAVINSQEHELAPDFESIFSPEGQDQNEIIFSARFIAIFGNGNWFSQIWNQDPPVGQVWVILDNLIDDFYCIDGLPIDRSPLYNPDSRMESRDMRLNATLWPPAGEELEGEENINLNSELWAMKKYIRKETGDYFNGERDFIILRYADVLLMHAEALVETGNLGQQVYDAVNEVRERSSMPKIEDVEGIGLTQQELKEIIRHERRVEFAAEGTRYWDLVRWGIMAERSEAVGKHWEGRYSKWPLPQAELESNPALVQHPEWQ